MSDFDKVNFNLVSPTGHCLQQYVDMAVLPGHNGDMGILPYHAALITHLRPGVARLYDNNVIIQRIFVTNGFAHINEAGCTVLVEQWILIDQLDQPQLERQQHDISQQLISADNIAQQQVLQNYLNIINLQLDLVIKS